MPESDADEWVRRLSEAMNPFGRLLEEMTETAKLWMSAATGPGRTPAEHSQALRQAAERMVQLSGAGIEPLRRLSEEHARFADEMATWAERHRQFAEQASEWAEVHRVVAERLTEWSQPVLRYAELLNESTNAAMAAMFPADPDGGATPTQS